MQGLNVQRYGFIGLLLLVMVGGVALLARNAASTAGVRELRIVARDMAFYVDGNDAPNPVLRLRAGERVRVVLRNEDSGFQHDFAIKKWKVGSPLLEGSGETSFEFVVPDERGTETYSCTPHSVMMRGTIEVE